MRTEEEVLKDFKKLGYGIKYNGQYYIHLHSSKNIHCDKYIKIYKSTKSYRTAEITMQAHKLLNELFTIWGWL